MEKEEEKDEKYIGKLFYKRSLLTPELKLFRSQVKKSILQAKNIQSLAVQGNKFLI